MLGRIRDALIVLIFGYTSTERRCRVLLADMNSMLEKMSIMLARDAKRQSREIHKQLEAQVAAGEPAVAMDRKAQLRKRVAGLRGSTLQLSPLQRQHELPLPEVDDESSD